MKKKKISDFSKDDLYLIRDFIETNKDKITMISELDVMILEKEEKEKPINERLTIELMEKIGFFDSEVLGLLKSHNIRNIQDLIDSDLKEWKLPSQIKSELEDAKKWYDFSSREKILNKK